MRRCYYEVDSDWEDITLEEMHRLAILETERDRKKRCVNGPTKTKKKKEMKKKTKKGRKKKNTNTVNLDQKPAAKEVVASKQDELDLQPAGGESPTPPIVTRATAKRKHIDISNSQK